MILLALFGFLIVIGPLVFVHELGHYWVGRLFGIKAEVFSIGMGREITGWNDKRGTRWKLSMLPIGGYVKFAGDMGPSGRSDPAWLRLPPAERAQTFQAKPLWQRFLVVAAGPVTNFLLAIAIFAGFFAAFGVPRTPAVIRIVLPHSAAERAGLHVGDRITRVGDREVDRFEDIAQFVAFRPGEAMTIEAMRGGRLITLSAVAGTDKQTDRFGNVMERGLLGIAPGPAEIAPAGPIEIARASADHTFGIVRTMVDVIGQIVTGRRSAKELGGPIQIAKFSGEQVSMGPLAVIEFMAMISINLGFINLLPIPMLDGGHLFFYLFEGVRRRPLPEWVQEWAFRSGLVLLLGFMAFVTLNDLGSLGLWQKLAGLIG
ncbi:regulator of sigma E protease [Sphingomonas vulcanisoli]|uniref:Zinc metalloprotease n=1 Tax=Sphingomonas vulcanisoli TaxID=1658060 RepID=A0ABX0TN61_9SPHN|nr:RIP metalloprotease RseP [Sphingomonas vulcanisoli]NIJ06968.1 regulator of sigma E protease [Sphingomonas vulcanisoli]